MTVRDFLTYHDLAAYADAFEAQHAGLNDLSEMTDEELANVFGMKSYAERKRFKAAVASLATGGSGSGPPSSGARAPTAPPMPASSSVSPSFPSSIGSYDLYECIGEGGMGSVYRGRHRAAGMAQRQGGDVAVKVVHAHLLSKGDISERFRREAEALALLDHASIVKVHDVVEDSGRTAIVMEWVPGRALSAVIGKETGPIPWDRAQAMVVPLLSAVAHAHSRGIVHRDLKPENIVVMPSGEIKLLDFGIARLGESRGRTKTGTGMGTVDYMAPEQFLDAERVDSRADVYALGLTLYEMLAGRLPWDAADSEFEVMSRKKEGRIPPPTEFYPSIPPWIVDGVMAAIRPNPLERTQSVEALDASLRGEGVSAEGSPENSLPPAEWVDAPVVGPSSAAPAAGTAAPRAMKQGVSTGVKIGIAVAGMLALAGLVLVVGVVWIGSGMWGSGSAPVANGSDFQSPTLGPMKWIPAGSFRMGSPNNESDRDPDETLHHVTLTKGYHMMQHEVTQGEWQSVMGSNPSNFQTCGSTCPVEQVSWYDAVEFGQKASARDGVTYSLPTEAQWEYAARGGRASGQQTLFAGSDEVTVVGWMSDNSGDTPHAVCGKAQNGFDLCDMAGNVYEWTLDGYGDYAINATDPSGAVLSSNRVFRGGSWYHSARFARVAYRRRGEPTFRGSSLGFRLASTTP